MSERQVPNIEDKDDIDRFYVKRNNKSYYRLYFLIWLAVTSIPLGVIFYIEPLIIMYSFLEVLFVIGGPIFFIVLAISGRLNKLLDRRAIELYLKEHGKIIRRVNKREWDILRNGTIQKVKVYGGWIFVGDFKKYEMEEVRVRE